MAVIKSTFFENGVAVTRTRERAQVATSGINYALVGGNLVKTYYEEDSDLVCWRVTETKPFFEALRSSTSVRNLIPPEFLGLIPEFNREEFVTGAVIDPPVLSGTELAKSEEQVDPVQKRVTTRNLGAPTLPVTYQNKELGGEQFGGEVTKKVVTLDDTVMPVDQGLEVISSAVNQLGPSLFIKMTEQLDTAVAWPILHGTEVDPKFGVVVAVKKQVVAAGTVGGIDPVDGYVDVKPLDKWRSIRIASKLDLSTLPAPVSWETAENFSFPNVLLAARFIWAYASTDRDYSFDAALLTDMVHGSVGAQRALVTESFTQGPPTDGITATVFRPMAHTVGFVWWYANSDSGAARANARTFQLPPCIHDTIDLGMAVNVATGGSVHTVTDAAFAFGSRNVNSPGGQFVPADIGGLIVAAGLPGNVIVSQVVSANQIQMSIVSPISGTVSMDIRTGQTVQSTQILPATDPAGLPPSGGLITIEAAVERWRFGIFYRKLVQLYVP